MRTRLRLIIVWGLFAAWVSWLAWQSFRHARFPVVSRAQLLDTQFVVAAEIVEQEGRPLPTCTVTEVMWAADSGKAPALNSKITVPNLSGCAGFKGAGRYVLPLASMEPPRLAGFPRSPLIEPSKHRPLIYPDGPEVRAQVHQYYHGPRANH